MAINRKRFVTRSEYAEQNKRVGTINKLSKYLNILIVVVSVLIVLTLVLTISTNDKDELVAEVEKESVQEGPLAEEKPVEVISEEPEDIPGDTTIVPVTDDAVVKEVHTNDAWPVHPTKQTGAHTSAFEKGHIDYEEKLAAIFSVIALQQQESIILSVRNNGSTTSAIAVVTSMDRTQMFRVSIEWLDAQGWKPVKLEVLKTVDGAY